MLVRETGRKRRGGQEREFLDVYVSMCVCAVVCVCRCVRCIYIHAYMCIHRHSVEYRGVAARLRTQDSITGACGAVFVSGEHL